MDYIYQLISLVKRWSIYFGLTTKQNFEDKFYQLLHDKNYDEALKLAQQHRYLDIDLVYKCKWRNNGITVKSINSVLGRIQDKLWAINECVQTVPVSHEACRTLIEFGLKQANLRLLYLLGYETTRSQFESEDGKYGGKLKAKIERPSEIQPPLLAENISDEEIEGLIDFDNLNDRQKELCRCRQNLIRHEHSLFAYESILGDFRKIQQHFDHVFYDELRQKCPLENCIYFANDGDTRAVETLLNFYTDELTPHLLSILSNFSETISPYLYRNLLPCLRENDVVYEWRALSGQIKREEFDWSIRDHDLSLSSLVGEVAKEFTEKFYRSNEHLRRFMKPLTADALSEWFNERALEMESRTLLLTCPIQLLHLGAELNIKNLTETRDNLVEFDRIVYDCCSENNIYLSFTEFSHMSEIDKLLLITGDSVKSCKDKFRFYVIPYLHRRESNNKLKFEDKANLLREFFRRLAQSREQICRSIYNDLLDKIECDDLVANWTNGLDDVIDEIGIEIKSIERERQAKQLSDIATRTMTLGEFTECYEACLLIIKRNFKECWPLCCQLGMHKQFKNSGAKYQLLAFALAHCEDPDGKMSAKMLEYIIELRKRDENIQMAYLQLNK